MSLQTLVTADTGCFNKIFSCAAAMPSMSDVSAGTVAPACPTPHTKQIEAIAKKYLRMILCPKWQVYEHPWFACVGKGLSQPPAHTLRAHRPARGGFCYLRFEWPGAFVQGR